MKIPEILRDKTEKDVKAYFKVRKEPKGTLSKIIHMNIDKYLPDISIIMGTRDAIRWRSNQFFNKYKCLKCNIPFTRGHVNTCLNIKMSKALNHKYQVMARMAHDIKTFNIIDFFLNQRLGKKFKKAIKVLKGQLMAIIRTEENHTG